MSAEGAKDGTGVRVVDAAGSAAVIPADHHGAISRAVAEVDAGGPVTLKLCEMEPGGGAEPHAHAQAAQVLLVVSGELAVAAGEEAPLPVPTGHAAVIDPGAKHEVRNAGRRPARYVALTAAVGSPAEHR